VSNNNQQTSGFKQPDPKDRALIFRTMGDHTMLLKLKMRLESGVLHADTPGDRRLIDFFCYYHDIKNLGSDNFYAAIAIAPDLKKSVNETLRLLEDALFEYKGGIGTC